MVQVPVGIPSSMPYLAATSQPAFQRAHSGQKVMKRQHGQQPPSPACCIAEPKMQVLRPHSPQMNMFTQHLRQTAQSESLLSGGGNER